MRRGPSGLPTLLWVYAALAVAAISVGGVVAAFKASTDSPGNVITAATDFRAPEVTAVAVVKSEGGTAGHVRQGGGYHVYANVAADTGEPASGIASVTADASALTAGSTAVALSAGSYTADGASYGYRSALLTADDPLAEGSAGFSVTATDSASNSDTASGTATVDNTAPQADDVQTSNASGGSAGLAEAGDTLTLTSSEILDPATILSGWTGASADVVVRIYDGGATADHVEIWAAGNASALPLGTVALGGTGYVTGGAGDHIEFGSAGTASSMAQSGAAITIALGSYQTPTAAVAGTESTSGTVEWTPSTTLTDRAGNALGATAATESGAADVEL